MPLSSSHWYFLFLFLHTFYCFGKSALTAQISSLSLISPSVSMLEDTKMAGDIKPLIAEKFMKAALEYMAPYKGKHIYNMFTRDFKEKTGEVDAGYGRWLRNLINYHVQECGIKEAPKILDFGCGMGELTVRMKSLGFNAVGLDANEKHLNLGKILAQENGFSEKIS